MTLHSLVFDSNNILNSSSERIMERVDVSTVIPNSILGYKKIVFCYVYHLHFIL